MQPYKINDASVKRSLIVEIKHLIIQVKTEKPFDWKKIVSSLKYTIELLENFSLYTPAPIIKIKSQMIGWDNSEDVEI